MVTAAVTARKRSGVDVVTVLTWSLKDFDRAELVQVGLALETPDTFCAGVEGICRLDTGQTLTAPSHGQPSRKETHAG